MCLSIPAKLVKIQETVEGVSGTITLGGLEKNISLSLISDPQLGEYVLVHAGFAIAKVDEEQARETLAVLDQMRSDGSHQ